MKVVFSAVLAAILMFVASPKAADAATTSATPLVISGTLSDDLDTASFFDLGLRQGRSYRATSIGMEPARLSNGTVTPGGFETLFYVWVEGYYIGTDPTDLVDGIYQSVSGYVGEFDLKIPPSALKITDVWLEVRQSENEIDFSGGSMFESGGTTEDFGCSNGVFCSRSGENLTNFFAIEIAVVPLPASAPLLLAALGGAGWLGRRRR